MTRLPPLAWMQAFEASARHLSFTAAGVELGVSQSAISQRIRLLEDRLGQSLFIRHSQRISLTDAARAWLPGLQAAFSQLSMGTAEVFGPVSNAPVILRATPGVQQYWLAPRLAAFHRQHPEIELQVVTAIWSQQFGTLDADIEIRYGQGDWQDVQMQSLGHEVMTPICAPQVAAMLETPEDLAGQTLLHATGFSAGWAGWLEAAGVGHLTTHARRLVCDTQIMTLRLAACGCGVALAHRRLLEEDDPALVMPFEATLPTREGFWLVRPEGRPLHQNAGLLWQWLAREASGPA
ncbi:LysR substrate-binding domain-containing protein [Kushneria marisflavi]|uniref:LysR family transcriptional regulator n=1 Tax=Kushneria marisflavi TaxID=157779 RepID=A0A240UU11_9GAMM|nr:LysR substrate-binding domain-containing protein [Kushneria marisflavi]ART64573.1 LysR family transcriptional regulator [Kushneria marisflavi]RKD87522.1 LysR family transcriptional regulator [Kushneria marisflavi]